MASRIDRDRLILILAGLLGKEKAEERLNVFEREIEQPLHQLGTKGGGLNNPDGRKGKNHRYPDNGDSQPSRRGTDSSYLMARLLRVDPDVAGKIGKAKPYRSITHAAQALGIVARRQRCEINPHLRAKPQSMR